MQASALTRLCDKHPWSGCAGSPARVVRAAAAVATDTSDLGALFKDALEQRPEGNTAAASVKTPPVQETAPPAAATLPSDAQTPPLLEMAPAPQPPVVQTPPPVQEAAPQPVQEAAPPPAPLPTPDIAPPVGDAPGEAAMSAPKSSLQTPDLAAPRDAVPSEAPSSGRSCA